MWKMRQSVAAILLRGIRCISLTEFLLGDTNCTFGRKYIANAETAEQFSSEAHRIHNVIQRK